MYTLTRHEINYQSVKINCINCVFLPQKINSRIIRKKIEISRLCCIASNILWYVENVIMNKNVPTNMKPKKKLKQKRRRWIRMLNVMRHNSVWHIFYQNQLANTRWKPNLRICRHIMFYVYKLYITIWLKSHI